MNEKAELYHNHKKTSYFTRIVDTAIKYEAGTLTAL